MEKAKVSRARKRSDEENDESSSFPKIPRLAHDRGTDDDNEKFEVAGRLVNIELENFMCHGNLKVDFNVKRNNCVYIGGPNGSGKSALFSAINIGLGGAGRNNDRGNCVKSYIKNGKNRAHIKITLTNTGEGGMEDFGDDCRYIRVERIINQTSSTYNLKAIKGDGRDCREETIKAGKSILDRIIARFGIELSNPIYWLSQDRARKFLAQTDAKQLYQIFMDASELESTYEQYLATKLHVETIDRNFTFLEKDLQQQRKEYRRLTELHKTQQRKQEMSLELQELEWLAIYALLRDAKEQETNLAEKEGNTKKDYKKVKQRQKDTSLELAEYRDKLEQLAEETRKKSSEVEDMNAHLREYEDLITPEANRCKELKMLLQKNNQDIELNKDNKEKALERIKSEKEKMARDENSRKIEQAWAKLDELKLQEDKNIEYTARLEESREKINRSYCEAHQMYREKLTNVQLLLAECNAITSELDRLQKSEKNQLLRFGPDMPQILQLIERNAGQFQEKPLGPLATYVKVQDRQYLLPIERALHHHLKTFLFDNSSDLTIFKNLIRQSRLEMPSTTVTRFTRQRHDTRRNEPSDEYLTVLRVAKITDVVVENALIDLAGIESIVLFDSDQEAREVMNGYAPRNCHVAYTTTGGEVHGSKGDHGQYRFYACYRDRAQFLSDSSSINLDDLREQLKVARRKRELAEDECRTAEERSRDLRRKHGDIDSRRERHEADIQRVKIEKARWNREIAKLEDSDDGGSIVIAQQKLVEEIERILVELHEKRQEMENERAKKTRKVEKMHEQRDVFRAKASAQIESLDNDENVAEGYRLKISSKTDLLHKCDLTLKQLEEDLKTMADVERVKIARDIDKAQEIIDNYAGGVPSGQPDKPDFNSMLPTSDIKKMINKTTLALEALQQACNESESRDQLDIRRRKYEQGRKSYNELRKIQDELTQCLKIRTERYPIIRHTIVTRVKDAFADLIKFKFQGELDFKHDKKEIVITIKPHTNNPKERLKDIKGLSGGEKSYTTTCFLMALWEIMETPFRCMDEFDVFMDGHTRKTAMDLIVKEATTKYAHQQFIFFTPQGINEIKGDVGNMVATFEMPKIRD